ncbi:TetR/AcrR family transcriptional regulator [Candidatus Poribacteria bacterium]|nr:TetR/AcrR family transcriptional regulator [Candidatus Poribacteria bacterium]
MGRKSLKEQRRTQIIEAFSRCVSRKGLQKASIRQIAKEAGVQTSILHHYFKDREEMIEELVKSIVDQAVARYRAEVNRHRNPKTRFNKAFKFLFGPDMINDEHSTFFYDAWVEARENDKVRESFRMLYSRFREGITNLLAETGKSYGLSALELYELATMVVAIQDGVSLQWDMDRGNVSLDRMSRMTKRLIELYIEDKDRGKRGKGE